MTKKSRYVCADCGYEQAKWLGRCPSCNQYNTLEEVEMAEKLPGGAGAAKSGSVSAKGGSVKSREHEAKHSARLLREVSVSGDGASRAATGIGELDRVLGGGIVAGSMLLLGGDPGIGKSTLLLQICRHMASENFRVLYVSGEESTTQIKMRAERLAVDVPGCYLLAETDIYAIRDEVLAIKPALLLIDSIQTMRLSDLTSLPGSVTQVRECAAFFTYLAKEGNMSSILVGHVTKEGSFAGPRVLEHMVDTVLYFEGDDKDACRLIRAVKNRFGSTHEIGVFEMGERGLTGIEDPSAYMLAGRPAGASGSVVTCSLQGTRPLLTEVQALVAYTNFGTPRRTSTGIDYNRMVMLMAVLEKRAGYKLQNFDAYVNIAGGLRVDEPAADASVIAALASCYKEKPIAPNIMVIGEVGLSGELRAISQPERRAAEAARHGFTAAILPAANKKNLRVPKDFRILGAENIGEMLNALL
ncbi:MAG: DNA repair protein RadA [Clostridiales bacterium]|jgi:DNA repair protein RadA/Sms|nr:DNA repair protein RadA [Clostridiales bacterium]